MEKDPAFLFYPGDYLRDTQCLSEPVQVAYDRIMCEHIRNICISQQQLNFFTKRLTPEQVDELHHVLTRVDGGFQIAWVALSISKRREYSESRRKNRVGKPKNICKSYDQHMENENENENVIEIKGKGVKGKRDPEIQVAEIIHPFSDILKDCSNVCKLKNQLTAEQAEKLIHEFGFDQTREILLQMENYKGLDKKYQSVHLTALNWLKRANEGKTTNNNNHVQHSNSTKSGKISIEDALRRF